EIRPNGLSEKSARTAYSGRSRRFIPTGRRAPWDDAPMCDHLDVSLFFEECAIKEINSRPKPEIADAHNRAAKWPRITAALSLIGFFAMGAALTWNRWGDLIIDCGRELDTPRQLAEGKMLYRDVRYWYGPFAPYFNSVLFRVFGTN